MVRYLFYTIGNLTYQSPLVPLWGILSGPLIFERETTRKGQMSCKMATEKAARVVSATTFLKSVLGV